MKLDQPSEALRNLAFTIGAVFHLFYSSYQGNLLINQSENVFTNAYV